MSVGEQITVEDIQQADGLLIATIKPEGVEIRVEGSDNMSRMRFARALARYAAHVLEEERGKN